MAQGYYIESASQDNLRKYAFYVEGCIKASEKILSYANWMTKIVIPSILKK